MSRTVSTPQVDVECNLGFPTALKGPPHQIPSFENVPVFLTITEVSELLRIPQGTLRYWRHAGIGPRSVRFGRRVVYRSDDIKSYVKAETSRTGRGEDTTDKA